MDRSAARVRGEGDGMKYELSGTVMQTVAIDLMPGEVIYSQTNSMCWMNDSI